VLEASTDGATWSQVATMTAVPGTAGAGSYAASLTGYAASGRTYLRARFIGDAINDASASATWSFLPKARVSMTAKVAKRVVTVAGSIAPMHTGATTVKVVAERLVKGKVKATKTLVIRLAAGKATFSGKLTLVAGSWRVKVTHVDANHASSVSAAKTVTVK
jgi:hypothetical protein